MMPESAGAPDARAIPRQMGMATKKTINPDGTSVFQCFSSFRMVQFVKITEARYEERSRSTYIRAGAGRHQRCGEHASGLGSRIQLPTVPLAEPLKCRPCIVRARSPASHQSAAPVAILQLGWLLRCSSQKTHECWQEPIKCRKKLTIAIAKSTIADAPKSHFPANTINEIFIFEIILHLRPP